MGTGPDLLARLLVGAGWMASHNAEELDSLRELAQKLSLPDLKVRAAGAAVNDVLCLPDAQRPDKFDFDKLIERLEVKLPSLVPPK